MSREHEAIKKQENPVAVIRDALCNLGLQTGMIFLVHASLNFL